MIITETSLPGTLRHVNFGTGRLMYHDGNASSDSCPCSLLTVACSSQGNSYYGKAVSAVQCPTSVFPDLQAEVFVSKWLNVGAVFLSYHRNAGQIYKGWRKKNACFSNNCDFVYFQYKKIMSTPKQPVINAVLITYIDYSITENYIGKMASLLLLTM